VIGEDQRVISGIVDQIKKHSGNIFGHVTEKKVEIVRLEAPEDYAEPEYVPSRQPIVVELVQLSGIKIPIEGLTAEVAEADVSIFPMGIAIGHIKFLVNATREIDARDLYLMEAEIFRNCRALQTAWPESQLSASLRRAIDAIRESVATFFGGSGMTTLIREPSHRVDYFYPLYYIGANVSPDGIRKYLCLLYMRPSNESISSEELERALRSNASVFSEAWLIAGGEGAIMAGTEFSGARGESYSRALEIASYVWYTMFILDAYLSAQIKQILNTPIDQLTLRDTEEQLKRIRNSRALVHDTLEEYRNIRVSLWASIIRIFDRLFEVVDVDRIEQSVNGKLEILGYV